MRRLFVVLLVVAATPLLTGCLDYIYEGGSPHGPVGTPPPAPPIPVASAQVHVAPDQVTVDAQLELDRVFGMILTDTRLQRQTATGSWVAFGRSFQLNSTEGGCAIRVVPNGWVTSMRYKFDDGDWQPMGRPHWQGWVPNPGDNGAHPLHIEVTYYVWQQGERVVGTRELNPRWVYTRGPR
ncbi:MAG: hypothetical protein HY975_00405 [Candidatus Kerfeldbacteria bacterium]|nr:hypothetical protein [Candidatus Kerfeldbacteria bacterium]